MKPGTYRLAVFSTLAVLLAIISAPSSHGRARRHPLCEAHPVLSALCRRVRSALTRPVPPRDVVSLTRALMAIPSASGSEQAALRYAARWLGKHKWRVATQALPPLAGFSAARHNVFALRDGAAAADVRVLLCTHLDTVPGLGRAPDAPELAEGRLRGRGSVDAKAQAAAMMLAGTAISDPRVALLLLSGEEVDHAGMKAAHKLGFSADVVLLNGEPTESKIAVSQKGIAKVDIRVQGRAAHSGYPELGDSAVHKLVDVLAALRKVEWPVGDDGGRTTLNVGSITGGVAANVVAPSAAAGLLFRLIGPAEPVFEEVRRVIGEFENVTMEVGGQNAPVSFFVPERVAAELGTTTVAYNTDVPYYDDENAGAVLFGAGSITTAHTENEYINVDELELLPKRLQLITEEILET